MNEKHLKQIESQFPKGEKFDRAYTAFEGGIRVISKDAQGRETRYNVSFDVDNNASIKKF